MIRQRFKGLRSVRIVSWTAVAIGWVTAVIARVAIAGPQAPPPESAPAPDPAPQTVFVPATQTAATPALPDRGLVIIRHSPDPQPAPVQSEPVIRRVVVERVVPAPAQPAPARSSGS